QSSSDFARRCGRGAAPTLRSNRRRKGALDPIFPKQGRKAAADPFLKGGNMKTYDNNGKLIAELNQFRTTDGKSVTSNTQYSDGRVVSQNVSVTDHSNGKVTVSNVLNGKILP